MSVKESDLVRVSETDIGANDYVRVLDGDSSRKITTTDFADVLNPLLVAIGFLNSTGSGAGLDFHKVVTITTNYSVLATDNLILANTTAGVVGVTLPTAASSWTASSLVGQSFTIKRITDDANKVTVTPPGAELIDGNTAFDLVGPNRTSITVISDGTNWHVIS